MTQVFISYSRKDLEFVDRLADDLKSTGFDVWYDLSGLAAGTRWGNEIQKAIHESQYFLVVLSPNSIKSDWVEREFLYASDQGLKIIPLLYQPCSLPMWSLNLHFIDMQGKNYTLHFQELLKIMGATPEVVEENPIALHYIKIGDEYRKRGQASQAIESYQQALSVEPGNLKAHINIGAVHLMELAYTESAAAYQNSLQISSEDLVARAGWSDANMALGNQARAEGRMDDATHYYLEILRLAPDDSDARQSLANIFTSRAESSLASGQDDEALVAYSEAIKYNPQDAGLTARFEKLQAHKRSRMLNEHLVMSEKEISAGEWDKAIQLLNEALEIDPHNASIPKKITEIQAQQKKQQLEVLLSKVEHAEKTQRWDAAMAGLKDYLQLKPDDIDIQKRMADLMQSKRTAWLAAVTLRVDQALEKQDWQQAQDALQEALQLEPHNQDLQDRVARVKADQRAAEVNAILLRADQAAASSRWDDAIAILSSGLVSHPAHQTLATKLTEVRRAKQETLHQIALRLADVAARAGNWETAHTALNEVLTNEPDNPKFLQKKAQVIALERDSRLKSLRSKALNLLKAEQFDEALALWNEALTRGTADRQAILDEIEAVLKAQKLEKDYREGEQAFASKEYKKAVELFNNVLLEHDGYKDTARLMVKAGRLQRSLQKTPSTGKGRRLWWGIGAVLVILALGATALVIWLGKASPPASPGQVTTNAPTQVSSSETSPTITAIPQGLTLVVTSAEDSGSGTLRQAIMDARSGDTITFDPLVFPPQDPATIYVTSGGGLPRLEQSNNTIDASNAGVILDGSKAKNEVGGIIISSDGNTIMGLQIFNFGSGIYLEGGSYNTIGGDRKTGVGPLGQGNLLANCYSGIDILATSGGNTIRGNIIGTDLNGSQSLGNMKAGIWFEGDPPFNASRTIVGPDNIISNNGGQTKISGGTNYGGIVIASEKVAVTITQNSISHNAGPGIAYSEVWGAEQFVYSTPPTILYFELDSGLVAGTTCPKCLVEIFSNDGMEIEGDVTADEFGNFIYRKNDPLAGSSLTATTRPPGKNTSEYSLPTPAHTDLMLALDAIQSREPDYQTSFDSWENWHNEQYARLNNGKLIITSAGPHVSLAVSHFSSDRLMVSFEFAFSEIVSNDNQCYFEAIYDANGESNRYLGANFSFPRQASMEYYDAVTNGQPSIALSYHTFDITQPSNATVVILEGQIAVFVDGQLAYTAIDPDGSAIYSSQILSADLSAVCEFDDYKLWDLSGVELNP